MGVIFNHIHIYDEIIKKNNIMERRNRCFEDKGMEEHTTHSLHNNKIKHNISKSVQLTTNTKTIHPLPCKSKSETNLSKYNLNTITEPEHPQNNNENDNDNDNDNETSKEKQRILDKQLVDYALKRGIFSFQEEPIPLTNNDEHTFLKQEEPSPYTTNFTQSFTYLLPENYHPKSTLKVATPIYYDTISYSILKDKLKTVIIPSILNNINAGNLNKALSQSEDLLFYLTQIIPIEPHNK